jgi:cytochrome c oxidase cbb3-type subunit 3
MRVDSNTPWTLAALVIMVAALGTAIAGQTRPAQTPPPRPAAQRPPPQRPPAARTGQGDSGEAVARRLCGVTCHPFENAVAIRRTRAQWEAVVETMIGKGAKGTSAEFASVIEYLTTNHNLAAGPVRGLTAGPDDKPLVDPKAAEMGRPFYVSECQACHGPDARGTSQGANLVRSLVVLSDRYGSALGPYLRSSHPPIADKAQAKAGPALEALTNTQVLILAHFLRDRVNDTLRGSPFFVPGNVLTGDAKAGAEYFNGAGGCAKCHSPTGDLAAIGKRMDPVTLQQRFLFPSNVGSRRRADPAPVVKVTVTTPAGETLSGELVQMDDFNVSLRDSSGTFRSVRRMLGVRIAKDDPFAAHIALLPMIADKSIHDVVAYLETLK